LLHNRHGEDEVLDSCSFRIAFALLCRELHLDKIDHVTDVLQFL